jgi:hypothetical protein
LGFRQKDGKLQIGLPVLAPDANASVIALTTL